MARHGVIPHMHLTYVVGLQLQRSSFRNTSPFGTVLLEKRLDCDRSVNWYPEAAPWIKKTIVLITCSGTDMKQDKHIDPGLGMHLFNFFRIDEFQ